MKVKIRESEWYPVAVPDTPDWDEEPGQIEVDDETFARWKAGFAAFDALQSDIRKVAGWEL